MATKNKRSYSKRRDAYDTYTERYDKLANTNQMKYHRMSREQFNHLYSMEVQSNRLAKAKGEKPVQNIARTIAYKSTAVSNSQAKAITDRVNEILGQGGSIDGFDTSLIRTNKKTGERSVSLSNVKLNVQDFSQLAWNQVHEQFATIGS